MSVGIIAQARCASTRLPRKVMAPVLGRPLLAHLIDRLRLTRLPVIVATTTQPSDDEVATLALRMGVGLFRGSEDDVLSRYIGAARLFGIDRIVRVTADCPLIAPDTIRDLVAAFRNVDHLYVSGLPDGMGAEVVSLEALERMAAAPDITPSEREHVTLYGRRRPLEYRLALMHTGLGLDAERWTVDTQADLDLVRHIIEALYPMPFTIADIQRVLAVNPEWRQINAHVPSGVIEQEMLAMQIRDYSPALGDL